MSTLDVTFADNTTQQLALSTVDGITNVPIVFNGTSTTVPFERFVLADESVVFIFVLTAFISSGMLLNQNPEKFRLGYGLNKNAMVTPVGVSGKSVWNFQYQIRFSNDQSDYSVIEVISGELPPGLQVDSTETATDRTTISGKVNKSAFANNSWTSSTTKERNLQQVGFNTAKLELLDVNYVEGVSTDPIIISSPTKTFEQGTILQNMHGHSRLIESVSTYDDNGVTKTKIVIPYVTKVNRNNQSEYEAFELPRNEVVENRRLTTKKDANFKGFIKRGSDLYAYYKDINVVVETSSVDAQHQRDYTFTLGMRSSNSTTYHAQQQFTIRVLQSLDHVRDMFQASNNYPAVDVYYDPTQKVYVVDYILPLIKSDGTSTDIPLKDGVLTLNTLSEIEAFGDLSLLQNKEGVRIDSSISLGVGT